MCDLKTARELTLALPEATEQPHHAISSFRVDNKIFATVPDDDHLHIMLSEEAIRHAAQNLPSCEEKWWGKKLAAVKVDLASIDRETLASMLVEAWRRRAPRRLLDEE